MTPASSAGSVKKPGNRSYQGDSTASESELEESDKQPLVRGGGGGGGGGSGVQDPELRDVMDKINTSFPREGGER